MRITVFTPTYNRGNLIEALYRSLQRQTFSDFEWIVVDDGSIDHTADLFSLWCKEENAFPVVYRKVTNGGKHRAINLALSMAKGELFFIVDSDDTLPDDSLACIDAVEKTIEPEQKRNFCGVCGLKGQVGRPVGSTFSTQGFLDITSLEREKFGIAGDKAEVFYTAVLQNYPFPEFPDEKFVTEAVVWDRMGADGYRLRFFNDLVYLCDYLPDGLSAQGYDLYARNPKGWGLYIGQSVHNGKLTGKKIEEQYLVYYYTVREKSGVSLFCAADYIGCNRLRLLMVVAKDLLLHQSVRAVKLALRRMMGSRYERIKRVLKGRGVK